MNIKAAIEEIYGAGGATIVFDGILNQQLFNAAPFKVLWILREPWFKETWDMLQSEGIYNRIGSSPTWHPMFYVTFSILNGFPKWNEMKYIREQPDMAEVLRSVAYVNVKKSVGGTSSHLKEIHSWFKKGEEIIKFQLSECTPDIVIGCPPFMQEIFKWDKERSSPIKHGIVSFVSNTGKPLLIEAPHPSHRGKREVYVNTIVEVIQAGLKSS